MSPSRGRGAWDSPPEIVWLAILSKEQPRLARITRQSCRLAESLRGSKSDKHAKQDKHKQIIQTSKTGAAYSELRQCHPHALAARVQDDARETMLPVKVTSLYH